MRTIVVADAVMGLDNVLAVAGAAHGSYLLVVLGLLISVPIVVWGSTVVLKVVDRFPGVVYVGAGVLVWTAVKMVLGEPLFPGRCWSRRHAHGPAALPRDPDRPVGRLRAGTIAPAGVAHPSTPGPRSARSCRRPPRAAADGFTFRHARAKGDSRRAQGPHSRSTARATAPARRAPSRSTNTGVTTSWSCICSTSSRACRATSPRFVGRARPPGLHARPRRRGARRRAGTGGRGTGAAPDPLGDRRAAPRRSAGSRRSSASTHIVHGAWPSARTRSPGCWRTRSRTGCSRRRRFRSR